jgi:hypothetical protein
MTDLTPNQINFLLGLRELTLKYGVGIAGCGCCGSPFLRDVQLSATSDQGGYCVIDGGEEVGFVQPSNEFEWGLPGYILIHPSTHSPLP